MRTVSTRNQQLAQNGLELLSRAHEDTEKSLRVKQWFQQLGITLQPVEDMLDWGNQYNLSQQQFCTIGERPLLEQPDWFSEPLHTLQYAAPGLYVIFVLDNGRYVLTTVVEVKPGKKGTLPLLALEGLGKGWYDLDGHRTTKDGQPFQGSAYAGRIIPVDGPALELIERQELLTEITGYHRSSFREGGKIHDASLQTLHVIRDLLAKQAVPVTESSHL